MSEISIESKALSILETYEGSNNYIQELKRKFQLNKKFYPTRSQSEYIINNHDKQPKVAKKWAMLDTYFAQKLANDKLYTQIPEKVWVEKLLAEKDKAYHIWGKVFESESLHEFWLPKAAVIKDHTVKDVNINYEKYSNRPPLNHQKEAIQKLVENKRYVLADDMGLGKTTSTIIAALESGAKKILIICPASLKINWQREIENYTQRSVYISEGKNFSTEHDFVIINYDIIKNFHDPKKKDDSQILRAGFDLVVIDEAHYIKNELRDRTSNMVLRRLKENVLDLPDKIITPVYLRLKSKKYEEVMGDYYNWYEKNPDESKSLTVQFTKLTEVRQVIANEKVLNTIELAENIIEQGKKVIIFCNFTNSLEQIVQHFGKAAVRLDGSMSKPIYHFYRPTTLRRKTEHIDTDKKTMY